MSIKTDISNGLMTITIDRPDRKNSFTNAMYTALADAFAEATHNRAVKVVLVKGHDSCFSAGNDLGDFVNNPPRNLDAPVFCFLRTIAACPKPIVAQVQGVAVGIGTTLLLHCDLVYAADNARFSVPFVKLGLCPEAASSVLLPQLAGYQKAAELLLIGDLISAAKASECGFVTDVLPADQLDAHVHGQIAKMMALPAVSLTTTKRLMKGHQKALLSEKMAEEGEMFMAMLLQPPAKEAFAAFAEKRTPDFRQFETR